MKKVCAISKKEFLITDEDLKFYEKMGVPVPTLCPEERQRRRISFRNFTSLYQRKCDATGKNLISMYHAKQPFPVYENEYWWGDGWNAMDYAQDIDFSKSFFEQYDKLAKRVPRFATFNIQAENSTYSNFSWVAKNCYLVFGCVRDEDCIYGHIVWDSKNCLDNLYVFQCEWCSNCIDCLDSYDLHFSTECANCTESYFLHDCRGCSNCFACTNLRQKQYCFLNKQLTKEEYFKKLNTILPFSQKTIENGKQWLEKLKKEHCIFPPLFGVKNENITGNHLYECKNCQHSFDAKKGEDSKFLFTSYQQQNCYDFSFTGAQTKFCCDILTGHFSEDCAYCHAINYSDNLRYCEICFHCRHCFGCTGLRNAEYCIFNKQYSKKEYFKVRDQLIEKMKQTGEWGEFFPMNLSPFAYNEAIVNQYFPLKKEEVKARGWIWKEDTPTTKYNGVIIDIPETIENVSDDICKKILTCEATGKNYRIQKEELKFYQKMNLPIPRLCPDERHKRRMALRNPRTLFERNCDKCGVKIQTTFASERPEKVFCEKCYLDALN